VESTIVRTLDTTAMLVGPNGDAADKVAAGFALLRIRVIRVGHAAAACERLAVAMPQVVIVLGDLRADERDALLDRTAAVGALVLHVDPELDSETLDELIERAATAAVQRKFSRDEAARGGTAASAPPAGKDDDVDSGW
jgi:hypothetical protein